MTANRDIDAPINTLMVNYVAVLAAIPFVATLIGDLWYYRFFGFGGFAIVAAIITYILDIAAVFVVGYIVYRLAPNFGTSVTQVRSTRLVAYAFTPFFLLSIFDIIPFASVIAVLGILYGLYILYLGFPILTTVPKDKALTYVIVTAVATLVVYAIISIIIEAVTVAMFLGRFGLAFA